MTARRLGRALAITSLLLGSVFMTPPDKAGAHAPPCHFQTSFPVNFYIEYMHFHGEIELYHYRHAYYEYRWHAEVSNGWIEVATLDIHDYAYPVPPGWDDYWPGSSFC